jgi:signal transduction histidine kinase
MHTLLAVDDEPANQRAVRRALGDEHEVLTAGSGAEALAVMAEREVALVISDHRMPGMTGAAFLAETVERHPAVIRIVLTGYAEVEVLLDAINRGHVYHCLGKPWQAHELRQVVRRGLDCWEAAAERAQLLVALEAACARAEREAEQRARLLVLAAHELGTPVHLLLNALELLGEPSPAPATTAWLAMAARAADWLAAGIAQLHVGATVGRRRLVLARRDVDLRPLIEAAVAAIRAAAASRALHFAVAGAPATAHVDPQWLTQALLALLTNAVRWTPDGGRVRVDLEPTADAVTITVSDTGAGIAAEHLPHLFEPFSTAGGDLLLHGSGRFELGARGLGLGLATVRAIAEAHGGTVAVDSAPGAGTRVRIVL